MKTEKRNFDKDAASWDENPTRVKLAGDVASAIKRQVALTQDMNVLDFGCGTGLLTLQLQPLVHSIIGVDSSQGMLDVLNAKIAKLNLPNIKARLFDHEKGDKLAGEFDVIASSMTFHHVREVGPLLALFREIMAPGGCLCIADLDLDGGQFHDNPVGVFHDGFERAALGKAFAEAGFENVQAMTAAEITKPALNGQLKTFPVFLLTAHRVSR